MDDVPTRLRVKRGPNPEQEYSLTQVEVSIGRSSTNVIVIVDPEVSRRHASIRQEDGGYTIEDWGSTNGTFVNERRLSGSVMLHNGDEIRLGETILLQFLGGPETSQPVVDNEYVDSVDAVTIVESTPVIRTLEPEQKAVSSVPVAAVASAPAEAVSSVPAQELPHDQFILPEQKAAGGQFRRWALGCGCGFLLIIFLCAATVYFLDAYQQGRLLYCGPLRPFFEILLGPFRFAPICS